MLYYNTVIPLLRDVLERLMDSDIFAGFRLVGGTAMSLQIGHRESVDIDLFTDSPYGSVDFEVLEAELHQLFRYVSSMEGIPVSFGKSYVIGNEATETIKLDVFYTDAFIQPAKVEDGIRMATMEEIIAMKLDVIQRGGRKKDFWDIHALISRYSLAQMLALHQERYPYSHDKELILKNFTDFTQAESDFDPVCLKGNYWEFVKEDIVEFVTTAKLS